ncbi:MAG TPA: four helix bundle protein [Thermodesulfobacteriota bacterium]|nr:four helix bundle protein [Thermodesulfobacteriota bacterium]
MEHRKANIRHFRELDVYQLGMESAMRIFELSKLFPAEEKYSLTDQIRRSSRSVCANIGEGWRKRRYPNAFVSELSDADCEATETQIWLEFALKCGYLDQDVFGELCKVYDNIVGKLVNMMARPEQWRIRPRVQ